MLLQIVDMAFLALESIVLWESAKKKAEGAVALSLCRLRFPRPVRLLQLDAVGDAERVLVHLERFGAADGKQ